MSRRTGPRVRAMRALGVQLPGLSSKSIERRPYPPGQHGNARKKVTEYGRRLQEKQKLCRNYGVTERQLRRVMIDARRASGPSGERLLELLERRLDNAVYRAGFARSIPAARQLVNHGHVLVNGRKVDRSGLLVSAGQVVTLRARSRELTSVAAALDSPREMQTSWLEVDKAERLARVVTLPDASSVPFPVDVQLVVEFYSQRV
jgi:small subunit ribosomal protein S4